MMPESGPRIAPEWAKREDTHAATERYADALFEPNLDELDAHYGYRTRFRMFRTLPRTIETECFPATLVAAARRGWTEAAFNEASTLLAFESLATALQAVDAPVIFVRQVRHFCVEEALHVELCVRVAKAFGGLTARGSAVPEWVVAAPDLSPPLLHALTLAVRICCVGEAFSLPMLTAVRSASTAVPLVRAVLDQIVRDEARHGTLGFELLDWAAARIGDDERAALGRVASSTLRGFAPLWQSLRSEEHDGITTEGYRVEDVRAVGFLESSLYRQNAVLAVQREVVEPLAARGIVMP